MIALLRLVKIKFLFYIHNVCEGGRTGRMDCGQLLVDGGAPSRGVELAVLGHPWRPQNAGPALGLPTRSYFIPYVVVDRIISVRQCQEKQRVDWLVQ